MFVSQYLIISINSSKLTDIHHAAERTQTICILSVPATMTCHDLLRFTAPCHQDVRHFRILRDGSPNQYMALITFKSAVIIFDESNPFYCTDFSLL